MDKTVQKYNDFTKVAFTGRRPPLILPNLKVHLMLKRFSASDVYDTLKNYCIKTKP